MFSPRSACALAAAFALVAACGSDREQPLPLETIASLAARVAPARPGATATPVDEPGSYRIEFDRYLANLGGDDVIGRGDQRRTALKPSRFTQNVVRPFDATGVTNRSLGLVGEGGGPSRVTLVRPLLDDPRPRLYPPTTPAGTARVIAGRPCRDYRVGKDVYCVDDAGLVLVSMTASTLEVARKVTVRAATKSAAELAAELAKGFTHKERGSIRPVHPESAPPGTDYSLDSPPTGFDFVGRYAVVPLSAELLKPDSRKVTAGIVDVYVRGRDALVVERGGKLDLSQPDDSDLGALASSHDVDLGPTLGRGKAGIGGVGPFGYREIRVLLDRGRYVVVAGTLPEHELVEVARSLRQWPGSNLVYTDGADPGAATSTTATR